MAKEGAVQPAVQQELLRAIEKKKRGEKLGHSEQRALQAYLKEQEEKKRREIFAGIRKGEWCAWSGRQVKVLNEQAEKHGLPIGGATIDLPAVVRWLHDFLAANKHRLQTGATEGGTGSAAEAFKREQALYTRVKRQRLQDRLVPVEEVQEMLGAWGELSRRFGERLGREHGFEAQRMYEDYRAECDRLLQNAKMTEGKDDSDE